MPTYRINSPTIAMVLQNGHHVAHVVPRGALITIENGKPFDGEKLMEVVWGGLTVMMFTQDLRARATEMNGE